MEGFFQICNQVSIFTWKQLHDHNELQQSCRYGSTHEKGRHQTAFFMGGFRTPNDFHQR